ncbi:MAG: carbohydrate kinase, partial [Deltaproteobacteria bacterium]|nr:carbohydrate kinase [Deltaproteobacteria bacterium]
MTESYIAVIDIGKTNKKVLIFDQDLNFIDSSFKNFDEFTEEGVIYEDLKNMTSWIKLQIKIFAEKYQIKALSVTTHGATAFAIDKTGQLAIPPVAYTTDAGDDFREEFYQVLGSQKELKKESGTAEIGSLVNIGKLIYFWQKKWPEKWKNVWKILNMPQYFGYLFTGKIGADPTYVGCHTYLYNPKKQEYSSVVKKLDILNLLPEKISKSWEVLGIISPEFQNETMLPEDCIVTMGIHDSNASLLPYLVKEFDNFVLNSTGTWCVAMHPTNTTDFSEEELEALVFYNLNIYQEPVKTSIFKGGLEFDTYMEILKRINGDREFPAFNEELYTRIIRDKNLFIL